MTRIVLLSGSLREGSINTALARALAACAPGAVQCQVLTPAGVPLYDGDVEKAEGVPPTVGALKDHVAAAAGLVVVTPEYNQGVPGVLKNALDWMSRPADDIGRVFRGRPVAVCGATPGRGGTRLGQTALLPTLRGLGMQLWAGGSLFLDGAGSLFDAGGDWTDAQQRERAQRFMAGFATWAAAHNPVPAD